MGRNRPFRIIAYDVVSDRNRARLEKLARRIAARVQDSVFEGWLSDAEIARFLKKAEPLLEIETDSLRIYSLCVDCRDRVLCRGTGATPRPPEDWIV